MGLFIAIEGGDGSGKATQAALLQKSVSNLGLEILRVSFPRYGKESALFVENYLNGKYGEASSVHPDLASLPYALDRLDAKEEILNCLELDNGLAIADRYVASNLAHQGAKIDEKNKRKLFYQQILNTEYGLLDLPQPDLNIVLLVPSLVAQSNIDNKERRSYTSLKRDIHEADANHLERAKSNYEELCELYPDKFIAIECMNNNNTMRSTEDIHNDILRLVMERLV